jgi:hypothetical protein
MERVLVRRDQFNISPQGIVHKPTDAAFIPYPGTPYAGIARMGQLGNETPMGVTFSSDDVQRIMQELWVEYVQANPGMFNAWPPCKEHYPVRDVGEKSYAIAKSILGDLAMDDQTIEEHVARKLLEYFTDESPTGVIVIGDRLGAIPTQSQKVRNVACGLFVFSFQGKPVVQAFPSRPDR